MNRKGFTLIELIIAVAIIGILASVLFKGGCSLSDGARVGIVAKYSNKGIIWKTHEGQLILGAQGTVTTNIWEFSVPDQQVAKDIEAALNSQQIVKLEYHEVLIPVPWKGSTGYYINKVTPIK